MSTGSNNDMLSLDETLANLTLAMKKKQSELEEREAALEKAAATLKRDRSQVFGDKADSDVLQLNIGGDKLAVLRRTLTSVEGSMLASRFSGRWDESLEKDSDGNFFLDLDLELFKPMINYLRATACETPLAPPVKSPHLKDYDTRQDFYRLVEYFGMTNGIFPTVIEPYNLGEPGSADIGSFPDCYVKSKSYSTFTIQTMHHKREITSFEIILGNVERMQIGWINESRYVENLSNDNRNGVGEEESSIALDCCRGGLLLEGSFCRLDSLSIGSGSIIRCEDKGHRWFVNGILVASTILTDDAATHFDNSFLPPIHCQRESKIVPCFSGKGTWTISQIVLSCP